MKGRISNYRKSLMEQTPPESVHVPIVIRKPHSKEQEDFVRCVSLRQVIKAGRRFGKTVGSAIKAVMAFLGICPSCLGEGCILCELTGKVKPKRVLYAAPTAVQVEKFWYEVTNMLAPGIDTGVLKKDETEKFIERIGTEYRIKAKTAWNANTLRGDYADQLILEELQSMNEDTWEEVGQPMLLDNNGTAIFIFTPSSLKSEGVSKAKDPRYASKLYNKAKEDTTGRWKTFHFTSYDNPTLNKEALKEISQDMSADAHRREILAEDDEIELSWLVYGKFNEDLCKIERFTIPEHWPILSGHDFGSSNPATIFVTQVKLPLPEKAPKYLRYGDYVAFAEYSPGGGFSATQHVEAFKKIAKKDFIDWSSGGNITTEEDIRQLYRKEGWMIHPPATSRVNAQIDHVIKLMEQNQFYIFEDLYKLLTQINDCMWEIDEQKRTLNKVRDEGKYHLLACLRYLAPSLNVHNFTDVKIPETKWDEEKVGATRW